jgi:hypothetical protein
MTLKIHNLKWHFSLTWWIGVHAELTRQNKQQKGEETWWKMDVPLYFKDFGQDLVRWCFQLYAIIALFNSCGRKDHVSETWPNFLRYSWILIFHYVSFHFDCLFCSSYSGWCPIHQIRKKCHVTFWSFKHRNRHNCGAQMSRRVVECCWNSSPPFWTS